MTTEFRYYQQEADDAIYNELLVNHKCIVKMFCGTGKSRLMRYCRVAYNKKLVVYVVPSLPLLDQFCTDYLQDFPNVLTISSEQGSTTDVKDIVKFLKKKSNKIICVTYQSFETLVSTLNGNKIDMCIFDEAHHAIGKTYQPLIFGSDTCEKQIFFTATPKNANGVTMLNKDNELELGMCGKLIYDYSYFRGAMEGYLNPFEIRIDFYTENTVISVYESVARAILASGNSRVLTFHADVNGDRDASVLQFVNEAKFIVAFNKVLESEFPEKMGFYKQIKMVALSAAISGSNRTRILSNFDKTADNEIMVISSCQTIGEGIDTKNANMCAFIDPKSSFVAITQNIGRIVRKNPDILKPNSTILIPCWVDTEKYIGCNGDKDKCDEVIREDINKEGNFNGILNVMSALRQEDEDLYDACLHYPDTYSPQEIESNLSAQGYKLLDPIGDGYLIENLEFVLDTEIDLDEDFTDEELLARVSEDNNIVIEVHTNSLETPIEYYGLDDDTSDKEVVRLFKSVDEEMEQTIYQPITSKDGKKRNSDSFRPLKRENRFNVKVHTNPDVKVLWNLSSDLDLTKDICSCIMDCEVIDMWPQRFEELKAFMNKNERRPSKKKDEKQLNKWLSHQITNYKNKKMREERYQLWTQFLEEYKEYVISNDELCLKNFEKLKKFINANNKRPSDKSKNAEEKQLGSWINNQQHNYKNKTDGMSEERYNLWTQFLEEYGEHFLTDHEIWFQKFEKLKEFINENNKRPSGESKNAEEKQLGIWLSKQLRNYKNAEMNEERNNLWTPFLEEYEKHFLTDDEIWLKNFEKLKKFINNNQRRPSTISKNTEEKRLGQWSSQQHKHYKNKEMSEERYQLWTQFLEEYKKYCISNDEIWFQNFEELKEFINENNKRPSDKSKKIEEKQLGGWINNQQKNYNKKEMSEERYQLWTQFLKEYEKHFLTDDEKWLHKFEDLKSFINKNNKRPLQSSKNIEEKQLNKWLSHQITNYNKQKLNGERYQLWTQFLEEYNVDKDDDTLSTVEEEEEIEIEIIVKPKKKSAKLPKLKEIKEETIEKVETKEEVFIRTKPLITQFHNKFFKMRSDNMAQHFQENPNDFAEYHRVRDETLKTFKAEDIPCNRIIAELDKIKTKRERLVVDMGCGTATIARYFKDDSRFKFTNYDHVAINDTVEKCDISLMPLEDDSIEICIMSLALWGSNREEYIREAYRVLETNCILYIIDSRKRWSEEGSQDGEKLKQLLEKNGFQIQTSDVDTSDVDTSDVDTSFVDKWCYFKCMK